MTEYETISQLKNLREHCRAFSSGEESIWQEDIEALSNAIKILERQLLRGKPLDRDCISANTTTGEFGSDDKRVFCYGWIDAMTDEYLTKCKECGAFVYNAKPLEVSR